MSPQQREYYRDRAASERARAAVATSVAAEIHLELACLYEKLAGLDDKAEPPTLTLVTPAEDQRPGESLTPL